MLRGQRTGKGFRLADVVEVKLVEVVPLAGTMRFEMLSEPRPLEGSSRSFHKAKRREQNKGPERRTGRRR